jgi:hypothetical protein
MNSVQLNKQEGEMVRKMKLTMLAVLVIPMLSGCAAVDAADCALDIAFIPADCLLAGHCDPC